jgi:hypothetical protein
MGLGAIFRKIEEMKAFISALGLVMLGVSLLKLFYLPPWFGYVAAGLIVVGSGFYVVATIMRLVRR